MINWHFSYCISSVWTSIKLYKLHWYWRNADFTLYDMIHVSSKICNFYHILQCTIERRPYRETNPPDCCNIVSRYANMTWCMTLGWPDSYVIKLFLICRIPSSPQINAHCLTWNKECYWHTTRGVYTKYYLILLVQKSRSKQIADENISTG